MHQSALAHLAQATKAALPLANQAFVAAEHALHAARLPRRRNRQVERGSRSSMRSLDGGERLIKTLADAIGADSKRNGNQRSSPMTNLANWGSQTALPSQGIRVQAVRASPTSRYSKARWGSSAKCHHHSRGDKGKSTCATKRVGGRAQVWRLASPGLVRGDVQNCSNHKQGSVYEPQRSTEKRNRPTIEHDCG